MNDRVYGWLWLVLTALFALYLCFVLLSSDIVSRHENAGYMIVVRIFAVSFVVCFVCVFVSGVSGFAKDVKLLFQHMKCEGKGMFPYSGMFFFAGMILLMLSIIWFCKVSAEYPGLMF